MTNYKEKSALPHSEQTRIFADKAIELFGCFKNMEYTGHEATFEFSGTDYGTIFEKVTELKNFASCSVSFKIEDGNYRLTVVFKWLYETPAEAAESPVETITDAESSSASDAPFIIRENKVRMKTSFIDNLKVENKQVSKLSTGTFDLSDGKDQTFIVDGENGYTPIYLSQDKEGKVTVSVLTIFK